MTQQLTAGGKSEQTIRIPLNDGTLEGNLTLPESAHAAVLFAIGSGGSRLSSRNRFIADAFHDRGMVTLLVDLLTRREERVNSITGQARFDIPRLAVHLLRATDWLGEHPVTRGLPLGYFGTDGGAAASLIAAAGRPTVSAVVSLSGHPGLAGGALAEVRAAVLLIVGSRDLPLIDVNEKAYGQLLKAHDRSLEIIARATHLFEEPGALEEVARRSADWFSHHLARGWH